MKHPSVSEFVERVQTWDPRKQGAGNTFRYIDIGSVSQITKVIEDPPLIQAEEAPSRARQLVKAGDILVSTVRPNLNAVALVPDELDGATASTGFSILRPDDTQLDRNYLFHWVRTQAFISEMMRQATGQSYPAVSDKIVKASNIPLPPLEEQRRIAGILEQADALRRLRIRALDRLNTLGQAIFHEMFGDPRLNSRKFDKLKFGKFADIKLGKMLDKGKVRGDKKLPYLRNANVQWMRFDLSDVSEMDFYEKELSRFRVEPGDLLICEGGEPGRCAIWRDEETEIYYQKALHRARFDHEVARPEYIAAWFYAASKLGILDDSVTSATIAHLTGAKVKALEIALPPIALQAEFVSRIKKIDLATSSYQKAEKGESILFASLQHRAFRGEL